MIFLLTFLSIFFLSARTVISLSLTEAGSIRTEGGAGFEYMEMAGKPYLASANFWDGVRSKMAGESSLHAIERGDAGGIVFPIVQNMTSWGGHGVDHFTVPVMRTLEEAHDEGYEPVACVHVLVIPSYYGCERGADDACTATNVYYNWNAETFLFTDILSIRSSGPSQTDHFSRNNVTYLLVSENFVSQLSVFRLSSLPSALKPNRILLESEKIQSIDVPGIAACATAIIDDVMHVIAASYHDAGWHTQSSVYHFDEGAQTFILLQYLPTTGAHDVETVEFQRNHFLVFSEDRDSDSVYISSNVYKWNFATGRYHHLQAIPTDGAHAAEFFIAQQQLFLAIANFGDRHNRRYEAESSVYQYSELVVKVGGTGSGDSAQVCNTVGSREEARADVGCHDEFINSETEGAAGVFHLQATVATVGATDWEYFELDSRIVCGEEQEEGCCGEEKKCPFLAVSEEADMRRGALSPFRSRVYRVHV